MKIELKRIQYYPRQSEETNAFNADLYINGKKAGEASNQGHGGPTDYGSYTEEVRQLIKEAEQYCKTLPPTRYEWDGEIHLSEMNLEQLIDNIIGDFVQQKEIQKFRNWVERKSKDCFLIGKPDLQVTTTFRFKVPLQQILSGPRGHEMMVKAVARDVIPQLKEGNILLNANIPENILKEAGLKAEQYIKPASTITTKQSQRKGKSL